MAVSWRTLGVSVGINSAVVLIVFVLFNFLRRQSFLSDFYAAKRKLSLPFRFRPPRLPPTWLTWMLPVFQLPDEKVAVCAGMDALVYVRFLGLAMRIAFTLSVVVLLTVLPTNWTGDFVDEQLAKQQDQDACLEDALSGGDASGSLAAASQGETANPCTTSGDINFFVTSFDKTALTNVRNGSSRMWVHLLAVWAVTLIVLKMLWTHYEEAVKWRVLHLAWTRKGETGHTILVQDIPGTPYGTMIGRIYDNLDGTIGRLLPAFFKAKVRRAMHEGVGAVFGAVKGKLVGRKPVLFQDDSLDKYLLGEEKLRAPDKAEFVDASSHLNNSLSGSLNNNAAPSAAGVSAVEGGIAMQPQPEAVDENGVAARPGTVAGRRNLRNFKSRPPATDFETWAQAEAALQAGLSMHTLVEREFSFSFGADEIAHVSIVKNEARLGNLVQQHNQLRLQIEDLADSWTAAMRRRAKKTKRKQVTVRPKRHGAAAVEKWGTAKCKVDQMEFNLWKFDDLLTQIHAEQERVRTQDTCAAFVTFHRRQTQTLAAQGLMNYDESLWKTDPAPAPQEVLWQNVSWRGWERSLRLLLAWGTFVVMILFFLPVVAFVQGLINLEQAASAPGEPKNFVRWILDAPFLGGIIQSVLPTLALKIFLVLVPIILAAQARYLQGVISKSAVDFEVGRKYYLFQFMVVFIFNTVIGAMLQGDTSSNDSTFAFIDFFRQLAEEPGQILTWLGSALPQQASFYIMYILTNGLFAKGIAFLRLPGAAIYLLLTRLSGTKRQKKRCWSQQYMRYGDDVPDHTITVLLMLVFCIVQPLLTPVAFVYFGVNYFYARYDLLYVKREAFQSGGLFWPVLFDQMYLGMLVALLGYTALFGIKKFAIGTILCIPLIVIVLLFRQAVASAFSRPMQTLSLHAAADLDRADEKYDWMRDLLPEEEHEMKEHGWDTEDVVLGPIEQRYVQPSLLSPAAQHEETVEEARAVSKRLDDFLAGGSVEDGEFMLDDADTDDDGTSRFDIESRPMSRADLESCPGGVVVAGEVPLKNTAPIV